METKVAFLIEGRELGASFTLRLFYESPELRTEEVNMIVAPGLRI